MPVRNGMPYLAEAFESIRKQIYTPLEVVVVDDGSTDGSVAFARGVGDLPVRVLELPGVGPAAARNAGIRASASELVAFLDADDCWHPGVLPMLVRGLAERPEAGFARGLIRNFRTQEDGTKRFFTPPYRFLNLGSCVWRRAVIEELGLLDSELTLCEDLDLLMRAWEKDIVPAEVEAVMLWYRRHPGNMTQGLTGAETGTVRAYKKRMERIRRGEFDSQAPRRFAHLQYVGAGPPSQDEPGGSG
jgi:glycosyltransferase involved in cell wall biosynthesis